MLINVFNIRLTKNIYTKEIIYPRIYNLLTRFVHLELFTNI